MHEADMPRKRAPKVLSMDNFIASSRERRHWAITVAKGTVWRNRNEPPSISSRDIYYVPCEPDCIGIRESWHFGLFRKASRWALGCWVRKMLNELHQENLHPSGSIITLKSIPSDMWRRRKIRNISTSSPLMHQPVIDERRENGNLL